MSQYVKLVFAVIFLLSIYSTSAFSQFTYSVYNDNSATNNVFEQFPDFSTLTPVYSDPSDVIAATVTEQISSTTNTFGLVFTNTLTVSTTGIYDFQATSDAGSKLYIDGILVVDNANPDGSPHVTPVTNSNQVSLTAGTHSLRVEYFEYTGGEILEVLYRVQGGDYRPIPATGMLIGTIPTSHEAGEWGALIPWPHVAISAANLPDGRILTWSSRETDNYTQTDLPQYTHSDIFDPSNETFQNDVDNNFHDMFCSGLSTLENGNIVASGGNPFDRRTSMFDVSAGTWGPLPDMIDQRWYGTNVTLPNNQIFSSFALMAGNRSEKYDPDTNTWTATPNASMQKLLQEANAHLADGGNDEWYAHLAVQPNGRVFHGGPSQTLHSFDPVGGTATEELGQLTGNRYRMWGNIVTYDIGKVLMLGGLDFSEDNKAVNSNVYLVDLNGATPVITSGAPMNYPRVFNSSTTLPNGEILLVGGNTNGINFSDDNSILPAEIYNPTTNSWRIVDSIAVPRNYHSTSILLKDGRVLSAGGGACGEDIINGAICSTNHLDGQIFTPPYLFNSDGTPATRPTLSNVPAQTGTGQQFTVTASGDTQRFSMIRLSATTHGINTDQRYLPVSSINNGNGTFTLTMHPNQNVLIGGNYWLYAVNANGTPSIGENIQVLRSLANNNIPPTGAITCAAENEICTLPATAIATVWYGAGASWNSFQGINGSINCNDALFGNPNPGVIKSCVYLVTAMDTDGDGVIDSEDAFPNDPNETTDTDGDGVGDNADPNPNDPNDNLDNDGDGVVNNQDAFPNDPNETTDTDGDGVGDNGDAFPNDPNETLDTDGDGVGDNADSTPTTGSNITALPSPPRNSTTLIVETSTGTDRIWNVNPDNNSVSVSSTAGTLLQEIPVGANPWSLTKQPNANQVFVTNKKDASISIINTQTLIVDQTISLPFASQPHGIVFNSLGTIYYVVLEATLTVEARNANNHTVINSTLLTGTPRHISIPYDDSRLLVSNFITPPIPGESTISVDVQNARAEIFVIDPTSMVLNNTIVLSHDNRVLSETKGPGIPNYLNAAVISFNNQVGYIPSKKDNIDSGMMRGKPGMTFDSTVRANTSRIILATETQDNNNIAIDFDNASVATGAALTGESRYLLVALETSNELAVYDTVNNFQVMRLPTGRAPQGVALSTDSRIVYVHNFMDRSVSRFDLSLMMETELPTQTNPSTILSAINVVGTETLSAQILLGKQLFYDAADDRLARDNYMSCASCHNEGDSDGRVWDISAFGEGLRNTISLQGHGSGHGRLHWTSNFDEVQDFEGQIRSLAGGTGLMTETDFAIGTRSEPLGDAKTGVSNDLDALAAYVNSLTTIPANPNAVPITNMSNDAKAGQLLYIANDCSSCHTGTKLTDSDQNILHDIGTLDAASGQRLGAALNGLDTPTLLGIFKTAPYLHDGAALTLADAIDAHNDINLSTTELNQLTAFLEQANFVDTDGDGVLDPEDNFPNDPNEVADTDGDGVGDNADAFPNDPNEVADTDGDGVGDNADAFPNDPNEVADTDGDGVGDNADAFPNDPNEVADTDGDGVGDNADAFPNDPNEVADTDGDGVGDNADAFPNDPNEVADTDGDGVGDNADAFPNDPNEVADTDGDGVGDNADAFPNDPNEVADTDGDGVGDNADAFPNDPNEVADTDGDGVGDNADAFPNDPNEVADTDGDGVGDNADAFPNDPNEVADTDGDGVGDNADAFPNDPNETTDSDGDGIGDNADQTPFKVLMTSPANGATLTSGSEIFAWSANGNAVTEWWFRLGTKVGGQDIYESGNLGGTSSVSVSTLPTNGSTIYGRLFYRNGGSGAWKQEDFTFTAFDAPSPMMTSPANGATLTSGSETFAWSANGNAVTEWWFRLGTKVGGQDIYESGNLGGTSSVSVSTLPTNGSTIYGRLFYRNGGSGAWKQEDFTFTAFDAPSPMMTSPANGTTLTSGSETFAWSANGNAVTEWWFRLGTKVGGQDIYESGNLGGTSSVSVSTLPTNGSTIYGRLFYRNGGSGAWKQEDFTFTAFDAPSPMMTSPANGTTLTSGSETFAWSANGNAVTEWWFRLGTKVGGQDIYESGNLGGTSSVSVSTLPTNGSTIYGRLFYRNGGSGAWKQEDFTFTAFDAPSPMMTSPANGTTLTSGSETFAWSANGNAVTEWWFRLGTKVGGQDIYESGNLGGTSSVSVSTLPTNGSTIYGRLFYRNGGSGAWKQEDFTFTAFDAPSPMMTSPANGATLTSGSETFAWSANGNAVTEWWFRLGTKVGGQDIYESGNLGGTSSVSVSTLPTNGSTIYGRLFYRNGGSGAWKQEDFTFTAFDAPSPMMTSPANGATLTSGSETFAWSANGNAVTEWWFRLGTKVGGQDIYESGNLGGTSSVSVSTLPTNGSTIYGRLFYRNGGSGAWKQEDFTFTAFDASTQ